MKDIWRENKGIENKLTDSLFGMYYNHSVLSKNASKKIMRHVDEYCSDYVIGFIHYPFVNKDVMDQITTDEQL